MAEEVKEGCRGITDDVRHSFIYLIMSITQYMPIRIGINGAGRIGRLACRACIDKGLTVAAINDPFCSKEYLAYLLKHDSTHGAFQYPCEVTENGLSINNNEVKIFAEKQPHLIPWASANVNIVLECTGVFTLKADAEQHFGKSKTDTSDETPVTTVKKVIISAPSKDADMFVMGCNQHTYNCNTMKVISNASCTTNCLAPLAYVIDQTFGIKRGLMSTIHAVTNTQPTVDGMSKKDWRGGRSALCNIIPATTGAAKAVGKILPDLNGKLTGMAFRVPTIDVSVVDLTVETEEEMTMESIKAAFEYAAGPSGPLNGVLSFVDDDVVSSDFLSTTYTCNFDYRSTIILDPHFAKFVAFYDNERGYATKLIELAVHVGTASDFIIN